MKSFLFLIFIASMSVHGDTGRGASYVGKSGAQKIGSTLAGQKSNDGGQSTIEDALSKTTYGTSRAPGDINFIPTVKHDSCGLNSVERCSANSIPLPSETLDMAVKLSNLTRGKYKTRAASEDTDCGCLEDELAKGRTDKKVPLADIQAERKRINDKILETFGRKFINSFAMNLEDASFFAQTPNMFSTPGMTAKLQCRDVGEFNQMIDSICSSRNITDKDFIKKRKDLFINAINPRGVSFDQGLDIMGRDILSLKVTTSLEAEDGNNHNKAGMPSTTDVVYVRDNYDKFRLGLSHDSPKAIAVNTLLTQLLRKDTYAKDILEGQLGEGLPFDAIVSVIKKNRNKKEFTDLVGIGSENLAKYFGNENEIKKSLSFLMNTHPGVMYALQDKTVFSNLSASVKREPTFDIIHQLENDKTVLQPVVQNNCSNMISEFANAVCTTDENLISRVDPKDLEGLLHKDKPLVVKKNGKQEVELHELLICLDKAKTTQDSEMITDLSTFISKGSSDYLNRIAPALGGDHSGFSSIARMASGTIGLSTAQTVGSGLTSLQTQLQSYTDAGNRIAPRNPTPGMLSQEVHAQAVLNGRVIGGGSQEMSKADAEKIIATNRSYEQSKSASKVAQNSEVPATSSPQENVAKPTPEASTVSSNVSSQIAPAGTNYAAATATTPVANTSAKQSNQAREQLRQYIAEKNDPGEATRAVNALDDASVKELNKLRNEKNALLEQQLKDGEARLKDLKSQLAEATSKAQSPVPDRNIASVDDNQGEDDESSSGNSSGRNPRSLDQRSPNASGSLSNNQSTTSSSGGASTGSSKSGSNSPANNVSKEVAETESQVPNSSNGLSDNSGSIVITAADVKASGTLPSQELNQEVQKFLANSDLSSASIQDIKSKGIKIRFNVMENNKLVQKEVIVKYENLDPQTRSQIDLKFASKNVQNQVSKLAVLRMLIKQNKPL